MRKVMVVLLAGLSAAAWNATNADEKEPRKCLRAEFSR